MAAVNVHSDFGAKKIKSVTFSIFPHLLATWGRKNTYVCITESLCYSPETITTLLIRLFNSVTQLCLTFCNSMDCSTPGFPVHHQLSEPTQTHPSREWCRPTISSSVIPFSSHLQSFPASGSFPKSQFFASGTGVSASASVLPMNI